MNDDALLILVLNLGGDFASNDALKQGLHGAYGFS